MNAVTVAVVGAGLAGIACARRLAESGVHARVFEAQRAPGGRLATRRFATASFDHGAQYLAATDAGFIQVLKGAQAAGAAGRWQPQWPDRERPGNLWVGVPAMNSLPRFLAQDLDVEYGSRIVRIEHGRRGWSLLDDRGLAHADYTAVALALPAPSAAALAGQRAAAAARVRAVPMAPCWAVLVAFDAALTGVPDAGSAGDGILAWYARNGSKPGRDARDAFVLHATADWSREAFDQPAHTVQRALLDRFSELVGRALPCTLVADAHRWRHARVEVPLGEDCVFDPQSRIGFCGDWCLAARAEAAWISGRALGAALATAREVTASGKIRTSR
jgi:predicted NAD/FAD-dependent oxidoreductase